MTISLAAEPVLGYLLASLRILTWLYLVPPFNGRTMPSAAKIVLSVGLSLGIAPAVVDAGVPTGAAQLMVVALTQVVVGALLGFVAQLLLGVIAAAGSLVDVFGGFALAAQYDPLAQSVNTIFGRFHQMLATMLLFATGGHLLVIGGLLKTFEVLPLGETPGFAGSPTLLIKAFSMFFTTAVQIALPMIAVLFVADLGLALLTKVAPQMNALSVMLPAKIGLVLLLIGLSFPMLPEVTARLVDLVNESAAAIAGQAGSGAGSGGGRVVGEEKTEAPTAKKKKEARKEGQVPRTQELGGWTTLVAFGMLLDLGAGHELTSLRDLMARAFRVAEDPDPAKAMDAMGAGLTHAFTVIVVLASTVMVIGVSAALAQGGFYVATKSVKPKFSKLNPISGFKRLFGMHTVWEGAKMLVKSLIVGFICYQAIRALVPLLGGFVPASATLELGADRVKGLVRTVGLTGLLMAGADYAFQRRKVGKQVRMTKFEVKQESKQSEGDPLIKGAIRSRQMAAARNRMMADVPKADVVLVNPTHVAVALVYDPAAGAPRVVAKGAGAVAAKIRAKAEEAGVPLVRDVPLARALHGGCKVGQEIPVELFAAVAQVLAFVISRRTQGQRGGSHDSPRAGVDLPDVQRRRRRTAASRAPA